MNGTAEQLTREPIPDEDYRLTLRRSAQRQLIEDGMIHIDENGEATLTDKGKAKLAKRLNALPSGEIYLIEMAVLAGHGFTVTAL